jgi:hypothetical protein
MGKNQSASGLTNIIQYDNRGNISFVSGSTTLMQVSSSGAITTTGVISGSSAQSASLAQNSNLLQGTGSVGFATTASFTTASGSISTRVTQIEQVYATTGSNSFRATQSITGSLTVTGQIVAQTLNVQQVTSSIVFSSGSNTFGCDLNSRQTFTGSMFVTGGLTVNTTGPELQVNNNGVILGNLLTDNHSVTGSLRVTGSSVNIVGVLCGTNATFSSNASFSGNVAIGVTPSPSDTFPALQVGRAGFMGAGNEVNISANGYYSSPSWKYIASDTAALYNIAGNVHSWYTAVSGTANGAISWVERMRITNCGNAGIGTSSPCTLLHAIIPTCWAVNGTVANSYPVATFSQCDCAGGARGLQIGVPTGGVSSPVFLKVNNTGARFSILDQSNCENFTISGGNIGIGTSSPTLALSVIGQVRAGYLTGAGLTIGLSPVGVPNNDLNAYVAWSDAASFGENNGDLVYVPRTSTSAHHRFYTGNVGLASEKMRITNDGYLRLMSRGIQFNGDTADANSLDDYEEGNWTPVYQDSTSTPSYITQFGRYTKIGRLVHVVGKISASNLGGGNAIIIGGLPFSAADASDSAQRSSIRPEGDWSGFGSLFTTTLFRANGANFQGVRDNGSGQSIFARYNDYSGTLYFNFNATYYV